MDLLQGTERLAELLVRRRVAVGLTQSKLARKVSRCPSAISQWEAGARRPSASVVPDLSAALQIDVDVLASLVVRP